MKDNTEHMVESGGHGWYVSKLMSDYNSSTGGILSDEMIKELKIVTPCVLESPSGKISYGLTGYGYDMRVGNQYKLFTPGPKNIIVDPKRLDAAAFVDFTGDECIIPPNSFALAASIETFAIPRGVLGLCVGKSTYARCGIIINITPLEPEWTGKVTIEISNTTPLPARIYSGEGISQVLFVKGIRPCFTSYADKKGIYQNQTGITLPTVREEVSKCGAV